MATLKQLYTFLAVAETLQMSEAARRLYISQPTVSQTILELEREFGASFFERSPKFLRLTAKGALFREYARQVTVSYTHLRAHETGRNLVCRLLLEKKKKKTRMTSSA